MNTVSARLEAAENRPAGFDYLRLLIAVAVIAWHGVIVCNGRPAETPFWTGPLRPLPMLILPMFFALSGFLIGGSLERNSIPAFLTLRALRIFPALSVEVLLSALILGPLLTVVTLRDYFTDPLFARYFLNLFGVIQYKLPGLFDGKAVNLQLWTVPYELECYIAITALALLGIARRRPLLILFVTALTLGLTAYDLATGNVWPLDSVPPGRLLVLSFLFGVIAYSWRDRLPHNILAGASAGALSWLTLSFVETAYLAAIPVAYLTVWLGTLDPRRIFLIRGADYSYGIYLYGFPIQQSVAWLFPDLRFWLFNVPVSIALAAVLAWFSWTFIESKVMDQRKLVVGFIERAYGVLKSRIASA